MFEKNYLWLNISQNIWYFDYKTDLGSEYEATAPDIWYIMYTNIWGTLG